MEKQYIWHEHPIRVVFKDGVVGIVNDDALKTAITVDPETTTVDLVQRIQEDYANHTGKPLDIPTDSFVVEIWGHLLAEYYLLKYPKIFGVLFAFGLYRRFLRSCAVIDCGERGRDPNRWLWDRLVPIRKKMGKRLSNVRLSRFAER